MPDISDNEMKNNGVIDNIWALEEAYFQNLYKADYESVLAVVHPRFLAWPDSAPQPIDWEGSARFMKKLVPEAVAAAIKIEKEDIRVVGKIALTQFTIQVRQGDEGAESTVRVSRVTHTWIKEDMNWKLLGGMSCDR